MRVGVGEQVARFVPGPSQKESEAVARFVLAPLLHIAGHIINSRRRWRREISRPVCVLLDGGFYFFPVAPEIDQLNYVANVKQPTLINGRHDYT